MWRSSILLAFSGLGMLSCSVVVDKQLAEIRSIAVSPNASDRVIDVAIADINQDGRNDLVVATTSDIGSALIRYRQDESGVLQQDAPIGLGGEIIRLLVDDVDPTPGVEIIVLKTLDNLAESRRVEIFFQDTTESREFAIPTLLPPNLVGLSFNAPSRIAAGFFAENGDAADVAVGDNESGLLVVFEDVLRDNIPERDFVPLPNNSSGVAAIHLLAGGQLAILQQDGTLSRAEDGGGIEEFQVQASTSTGISPTGSALADLDQNGTLDLVVAGFQGTDPALRVFLDGDINTEPLAFSVSQGGLLASGDLDADGNTDLVLVEPSGNGQESRLLLLFSSGGEAISFREEQRVFSCQAPDSLAVGDLAGDGLSDVVMGEKNANEVKVLFAE